MAEFKVKTKGGANPQGKPRVYFTCHPDDFDKYFDKICEDVFKSHDCAIYYTGDMSVPFNTGEIGLNLGLMNLFLVPVTLRLLSEENRAMLVDVAFAKEHNIAILPFVMESGIDNIYSLPNNFGEKQYLSPFKTDMTAVSYEEKLKKILESILISDEMAKRVRSAFDAYIFLSYRKKDRKYANDLMRIIHNIPGCRDIAVWYDEFLVPGESFIENIEQAMEKSELFTLLVTPHLLEDDNFVITNEYPMAKRANMDILPIEMDDTDRLKLIDRFMGIPDPIKTVDKDFADTFISVVRKNLDAKSNNTPEHIFLIGLAYLDGIDVEVNIERGIMLVSEAAEAEQVEAMEKLFDMYSNGKGVKLNYQEALKWAKRIVDYYLKKHSGDHIDVLKAFGNLSLTYGKVGDHRMALEYAEKAYELSLRMFGEEHPHTLLLLNNIAYIYSDLGDNNRALELYEKCYNLKCRIIGEKHPETLSTLHNLANTYNDVGDYERAIKLCVKVYNLKCEVLGKEHPDTLQTLNTLAVITGNLGNYTVALEQHTTVYDLRCKILGEEHPDTIVSLNNLALNYIELRVKNYEKAIELSKKAYTLSCKVLGTAHPSTLTYLINYAQVCDYGKDGQKALELYEKAYDISRKIFGEEHPDTVLCLNNLAVTCGQLGYHDRALQLKEKVYSIRLKLLGDKHPDTMRALNNLSQTYVKLGDYKKALMLFKELYDLRCEVFGIDHPTTLQTKKNIDYVLSKMS